MLCHTWDSYLQYSDPESMGRVAIPGGDLLDDLLDDPLTPCAGTIRTMAFTIYINLATNSASWLYYILLILGRERQH